MDGLSLADAAVVVPGKYRIKTAGHAESNQPAGWGLAAYRFSPEDGIRDDQSSQLFVHSAEEWQHEFMIEAGTEDGTHIIKTCGHGPSNQTEGWGLSAFKFDESQVRDHASTWVSCHEHPEWMHNWKIVEGSEPGTVKILTAGHEPSAQPAGFALSAFRFSPEDGCRDHASTKVSCHDAVAAWGHNWVLEPVFDYATITPGTYKIKTAGHDASNQPAGWGLAAYRFSPEDGIRDDLSSQMFVHAAPEWQHDFEIAPGSSEGRYLIKTVGHGPSNQVEGWGLSAFKFDESQVRDHASTWVSCHEQPEWMHEWIIVNGSSEGQFKILTAGHANSKMHAGSALSAFRFSPEDGCRDHASTKVSVHDAVEAWGHDWTLEPAGLVSPGRYRIKTAGHDASNQPAGWGLAAYRFSPEDGIRDDLSSQLFVHAAEEWQHEFMIEAGTEDGTHIIKTCGHGPSNQTEGWGLSAFKFDESQVRDHASTWVSCHEQPEWMHNWKIVEGSEPGTVKILTAGHEPSAQPAGFALSAFRFSPEDGCRDHASTKVSCHDAVEAWGHNWVLEPCE